MMQINLHLQTTLSLSSWTYIPSFRAIGNECPKAAYSQLQLSLLPQEVALGFLTTWSSGFELKLARIPSGHIRLLSEAFAESSDLCLLLTEAGLFLLLLPTVPSFWESVVGAAAVVDAAASSTVREFGPSISTIFGEESVTFLSEVESANVWGSCSTGPLTCTLAICEAAWVLSVSLPSRHTLYLWFFCRFF